MNGYVFFAGLLAGLLGFEVGFVVRLGWDALRDGFRYVSAANSGCPQCGGVASSSCSLCRGRS